MPSGERSRPEKGFTYVAGLLGVALISVGLSLAATVWSKEAERQREAEAEWVLKQYERALRSYYYAAPGSIKTLPASLEELLNDDRHLGVVRHLRRAYAVPCVRGKFAKIRYQPQISAATLTILCADTASTVRLNIAYMSKPPA